MNQHTDDITAREILIGDSRAPTQTVTPRENLQFGQGSGAAQHARAKTEMETPN